MTSNIYLECIKTSLGLRPPSLNHLSDEQLKEISYWRQFALGRFLVPTETEVSTPFRRFNGSFADATISLKNGGEYMIRSWTGTVTNRLTRNVRNFDQISCDLYDPADKAHVEATIDFITGSTRTTYNGLLLGGLLLAGEGYVADAKSTRSIALGALTSAYTFSEYFYLDHVRGDEMQ